MNEWISCFFIAVALSMDTFSLSLGLGTYHLKKQNCLQLSLIVGLMHFIMPFLGNILGLTITSIFELNSNRLLGGILIFLAINLALEMQKEEQIEIDISLIGMFIFALGVSIDAFSTGLGLQAITNNKLLAYTIFSLTSFSFTIAGLTIGTIASNHLGKKASIIGLLLLLTFGLIHLFN